MHQARQLAAALVSPWPTWRVEAPDETTLLDRLAAAGPCPQADLFEPWSPGEPWQARVLWPDLADPARLLAAGRVESGEAPGLSEWMDRGRVGDESVVLDGLHAACWFDLEEGDLLIPDLVPGPVEPALVQALLASVGSQGEPDRARGVRHRLTGRPGVLLEVAVPDRDPVAERRAVLGGLAAVAAQAPLAPDARWWFEAGRIFALGWRLAPAEPQQPLDAPVGTGLAAGAGLAGPAELHVALPSRAHDALASALGEALGPLGWVGSRPRWGWLDGAPVFLACWEGPADTALEALAVAADHPCRVVPGCPPGLEPDWLGVDPAWWPSQARTLVRWRCGLRDRDLLPVCAPRAGDALDRALASTLAPLGPCEPVRAGQAALRLELPALDGPAWAAVVRALGALPEPAIGPVLPVALRDRTVVLLPRTDLPADPEPPRFAVAGL